MKTKLNSSSSESTAEKTLNLSQKALNLFSLSNDLLKNSNFSDLTYLILKSIQILQLISLTKNQKLYNVQNSHILSNFKNLLQYVTFNIIFKNQNAASKQEIYNASAYNFLSGGAIGLMVLALLLIIIAYCFSKNIKQEFHGIFSIMYKTINTFYLLMRTILFIPYISLAIEGFMFAKLTTDTNQTVLAILFSSLGIILFCILQLLSMLVHPPPSPFHSHPQACQPMIKHFFVSGIIIFMIVLYSMNGIFIQIAFSIPFFILSLPILILQFSQFEHVYGYISQKNYFTAKCSKILAFILSYYSLFIILRHFHDDQTWGDGIVIYFVIGVAFAFAWVLLGQIVSVKQLIGIKEPKQLRYHYYQLVNIIQGVVDIHHSFRNRLIFEGYIAYHVKNCNQPGSTCPCRELPSRKTMSNSEAKTVYYLFLTELIKQNLTKFKNPQSLYLLLTYIYQQRLKNRFQAIYYITRTLNHPQQSQNSKNISSPQTSNSINYSSSWPVQMRYYQQIKQIQSVMVEQDLKNLIKQQNSTVDLNKYLQFNIKFVDFEILLEQSSNNHITFWKQLMQSWVNLKDLNQQGSAIIKQKQEILKQFQFLLTLNSSNGKLLEIYGYYLVYVCNDFEQINETLEKSVTIFKNLKNSASYFKTNIQKYSSNSNTCIIILSGNQHSLGQIVQTNKNISATVGYTRLQLLSININTLMPKIFGESHDRILQKYLSTSNQKLNNIERIVPVLDSDGYMQPVVALTKAIPDLNHGIRIVGFLSPFQQQQQTTQIDQILVSDNKNDQSGSSNFDKQSSDYSYILYQCNKEVVMGISRKCTQQFGIPRSLIYGDKNNNNTNQLKIKNIFGINIQKVQQNAIAHENLLLNLDTRNLMNQFIIVNCSNSTKKTVGNLTHAQTIKQGGKDKGNNSEYGIQAKVVVKSILNIVYNNIPMRILQIAKSSANIYNNTNNNTFDALKYQASKIQTQKIQQSYLNNRQTIDQQKLALEISENRNHHHQQRQTDRSKQKQKDQTTIIDQQNNLKQFKSFTNIKNQPKAIKFVNYFCILFIFTIMACFSANFWVWNNKQTLNQEMKDVIYISYINRVSLSEILFQIQKTYISESDKYNYTDIFDVEEQRIKIKQLQTNVKYNQLKLLSFKNKHNVPIQEITEYILKVDGVQNGGINNFNTKTILLDYSIITWLSKVHGIINGDYIYLKEYPSDYTSLMINNYYEIKYTGIFSHIRANINMQNALQSNGQRQIELNLYKIYGINGFLGLFLLVWIIVSLPKTLQVIRINNRVLLFFKMIEKKDITQILRRCFKFQQLHLSQPVTNKYSLQCGNTNNKTLNNTSKINNTAHDQIIQEDRRQHLLSSQNTPRDGKLQTSTRILMPQKSQNNKNYYKDYLEIKKKAQDGFQFFQRQVKTDNKWVSKAAINYTVIFLFISAVIIFNFVVTFQLEQSIKSGLYRQYLLMKRGALLQQIKLTYLQYLMDPNLATNNQTIASLNEYLIDKIYQNQKEIVEVISLDQKTQQMKNYDTQNLCDYVSEYKQFAIYSKQKLEMSKQKCQEVTYGILKKGIKTTIVNQLQQIRSVLSSVVSPDLIKTINQLSGLRIYTNAALTKIIYDTANKLQKFIQFASLEFYAVNGFAIAVIILFWRIWWKIFINKLNQSVWNTKGMLNIIPIKIIANNSTMIKEITSGGLENAVK